MHAALGLIPSTALHTQVEGALRLHTQELEARSEVQGHPQLPSELGSVGYRRLFLQ